MIDKYRRMKLEEARNAMIELNHQNVEAIAEVTDVNLENPSQGLSLKERINDLEVAICEILDSMA